MPGKILKMDLKEKIASIRKEVCDQREKGKKELTDQEKGQVEIGGGRKYFIDKEFCPSLVADEIIQENPLLYIPAMGFYEYSASGKWEKVDDEKIRAWSDGKLGLDSKKSRNSDVLSLVQTKTYTVKELNNDKNFVTIQRILLNSTKPNSRSKAICL